MPRYHFHVVDDDDYIDTRGVDLADLDAARDMALKYSGAAIGEIRSHFWRGGTWTMRVTDGNDLTLFELMLVSAEGPALATTHPG
ncbi:MAG: hypothetical protein EOO77_31100 [Oxalobacteraceae bacterium]|nr:MAG: hypothetical protein EOO77_31100 [Oxalobacteraceae bacterium]